MLQRTIIPIELYDWYYFYDSLIFTTSSVKQKIEKNGFAQFMKSWCSQAIYLLNQCKGIT